MLFSVGWKNPYACLSTNVPYPVYGVKQHWGYAKFLEKEDISFYHMPHFDVPLRLKKPFVATVHDLIHLLFPSYSRKPMAAFYAKMAMKFVADKAARIIVVSENTKNDFLRFFPQAEKKMRVVYNGVNQTASVVEGELLNQGLQRYSLKPGYILYVGNLRKSKNTQGLLKAYEKARKQMPALPPLVLAGENQLNLKTSDFPDGVMALGRIPTEDLALLYSGALFFVYPSFYEGFGLPPLEAMTYGLPVLSSSRASLPEVCGQAADYLNPDDRNDMAEKMIGLFMNENRRRELTRLGFEYVKRFHWGRSSAQIWQVYEGVLSECAQTV